MDQEMAGVISEIAGVTLAGAFIPPSPAIVRPHNVEDNYLKVPLPSDVAHQQNAHMSRLCTEKIDTSRLTDIDFHSGLIFARLS